MFNNYKTRNHTCTISHYHILNPWRDKPAKWPNDGELKRQPNWACSSHKYQILSSVYFITNSCLNIIGQLVLRSCKTQIVSQSAPAQNLKIHFLIVHQDISYKPWPGQKQSVYPHWAFPLLLLLLGLNSLQDMAIGEAMPKSVCMASRSAWLMFPVTSSQSAISDDDSGLSSAPRLQI